MTGQEKIIVAGAGVVGICCGIFLLKKGCRVLLVDRRPPAEGASYGNAGVICNSGIAPLANPQMLIRIPWLLTNLDPRFRLHWPHAVALLPWVFRFIRQCNRRSQMHCVQSLGYLLKNTVADHLELLRETRAENYFNDTGWLRLYRNQNQFHATREERHHYREHGISFQVLNEKEIRDLEPCLTQSFSHGIWLDGTPSLTNPGQVCKQYADLFQRLGGKFVQAEFTALRPVKNGWELKSDRDQLLGSQVVVAMGAASPTLLRSIDIKTCLATERGYHLLYQPPPGISLNRSIVDVKYGFVMTPMEMGIRVTSGTDLAAHPAPPSYRQMNRLKPKIEKVLPLEKQLLDTPWMGERPSPPDSLPIIGSTKGHPGLWQAFGHGHLGLTLGPTTGKLIAELISGKIPNRQEQAFSPSRFL